MQCPHTGYSRKAAFSSPEPPRSRSILRCGVLHPDSSISLTSSALIRGGVRSTIRFCGCVGRTLDHWSRSCRIISNIRIGSANYCLVCSAIGSPERPFLEMDWRIIILSHFSSLTTLNLEDELLMEQLRHETRIQVQVSGSRERRVCTARILFFLIQGDGS